jgi:hypothetical protein
MANGVRDGHVAQRIEDVEMMLPTQLRSLWPQHR